MNEKRGKRNKSEGRYAYAGLDRVIHERARLGILTSLATHRGGLLFNDLRELCSLTDGNLSRHLKILSESGMIKIEKGRGHSRPQTLCRLTPQGRRQYLHYLAVLESVVGDAIEAREKSSPQSLPPDGWSPA